MFQFEFVDYAHTLGCLAIFGVPERLVSFALDAKGPFPPTYFSLAGN